MSWPPVCVPCLGEDGAGVTAPGCMVSSARCCCTRARLHHRPPPPPSPPLRSILQWSLWWVLMLYMMLSKYISISTLMPLQYHHLIRHRLNIFIWNNRGGIKPSKSVQLPKSKKGSVLVNLILPTFLSNTRLSISIIDQYCMDVKAVGNNLSAAYLPDSAEVWCLIVLCKPAAASLHTNVGMMECWVLAATATVITSSAKHPKYFHNDFHWSSLMISLALREST